LLELKGDPRPPYSIVRFDESRHNRANFCCENKNLDQYIKEHANQDLKRKVAVPFVLVKHDQPEILGYYTLSSFSVNLDQLPSSKKKKLPNYPKIPATLIGRLAVDKDYQGKGLGGDLLIDALSRSYHRSSEIGSFSVVVDANEEARGFYFHYGFQPVIDREDRLFLPMKTIKDIVL